MAAKARPEELPAEVTDNRTEDTEQRRKWREQARARYRANPDKIRERLYRWREQNPERYREARNLARRRRTYGLTRAYRKEGTE